jgi:hypothetical protein
MACSGITFMLLTVNSDYFDKWYTKRIYLVLKHFPKSTKELNLQVMSDKSDLLRISIHYAQEEITKICIICIGFPLEMGALE